MAASSSWPSETPFRGSEAVRARLVTWDLLRGPGFRRLAHDTYVRADVPDDPRLAIRAQVVRAGPGAVVCGWSACRWWAGEVLPRPEPPVEIAHPVRHLRPAPGVRTHRRRYPAAELALEDGVRVTTALRTAADLARCEPLEDATVAADALGRVGEFSAADLASLATGRGAEAIRAVARLMDPLAESPMETRTRLLVVLGGCPRPVCQYEVWDRGRLVARLDMAWPRWKVALEYDGHDHAAVDRRGRDLDRLAALRRLGWVVIVVTHRQYLRSPAQIARQVGAELDARAATR